MVDALHFFPNRKLAIRFCIAEYLKPARTVAVASVLLRSSSVGSGKDTFLSPEAKKRVEKVKAILAKGENPFAEVAKGSTGSALSREERERIINENRANREAQREPARVASLEAKWAARHEKFFVPEPVFLDEDMGPSVDPKDLAFLHCSFCGMRVDEINATKGTGNLTVIKDLVQHALDGGEKVLEEVTKFSTAKLVACPDHALMIKPEKTKHRPSPEWE